jgi:dipeptidyl aminopeptidase/acylaminoacyl peptidase
VTQGAFNVDEVMAVDEAEGLMYFQANGREAGRNVYYRHAYRTGLDGRGLHLLTPEDAEHRCVLSPSRRYLIDTYSRVDLEPRSLLRTARGDLVLKLEISDISCLTAAGWRAPEVFKAKSADGVTDQWGVIYKPFDFDANRKYPIVTRVYPGRQQEGVPREFWPVTAEMSLAQLGCVVVQFGNRGGTFERGAKYRSHGRDEFRDYGLADKKAVIEELARRHPWIDDKRVGIFGGSSGGFMTVSAMLTYPDFFQVGVAMTAPNDPSIYFNMWAERYGGVKRVDNEDGSVSWDCQVEGNLELADRLRGRLLLVYGEQDQLVHPAQLYRMAQAFVTAGKRFDMFVVPGAGHDLGDWEYPYGLVWDYFAEHLIGAKRDGAEALLWELGR